MIVGEEGLVCPTWRSFRGKHRLFAWDPGFAGLPVTVKLGHGLEARLGQDRAQSVLPPAGGRQWLVTPYEVDPPRLPPTLKAAILQAARCAPAPHEPREPHMLFEGTRNIGLTSLAGKLRRAGLSQGELEIVLLHINQSRCRPPLPEREVVAIARSIGRYPPGPSELPWALREAWRKAIQHRKNKHD